MRKKLRPRKANSKKPVTGLSRGSQTLVRGLNVLEAVASGVTNLSDLAATLELNRSTTHRLASALVEKRYLNFVARHGYELGLKTLEVGYQARTQLSISRIAHPYLEKLAAKTGDTVHLGVLDGNRVLYLDKIPGRRRVEISSRIGELQPLRSTGLGKALLLDQGDTKLCEFYRSGNGGVHSSKAEDIWLRRMREYARKGYTFDLEENEDFIRCVAAPVRDTTGQIRAAVSVSSLAHYMNDERMRALIPYVRTTAEEIGHELGHKRRAPISGRKSANLKPASAVRTEYSGSAQESLATDNPPSG
jgi:DNA-binding IclR family transcriptional regulator